MSALPLGFPTNEVFPRNEIHEKNGEYRFILAKFHRNGTAVRFFLNVPKYLNWIRLKKVMHRINVWANSYRCAYLEKFCFVSFRHNISAKFRRNVTKPVSGKTEPPAGMLFYLFRGALILDGQIKVNDVFRGGSTHFKDWLILPQVLSLPIP